MDVRELQIRSEVEDLRYEPAVDLGDVVKGKAPQFVQDPIAFFERTHLTDSMKKLIIKALMNLIGLRSLTLGGRTYEVTSNIILLPSDLGGGKTHTMILLYHIINLIKESQKADEVEEKLRILDEDIADLVRNRWKTLKSSSYRVAVIDCKYSDLAPSPARPIEIAGRKIKTLWGYLGYELGRYEAVRSADERGTAPYADDILEMLNESRALVLIDEIGRYYDLSGLEPTRISAFLMNLAEAMSKYTVREVSVIVSIPYEVKEGAAEAKAGMEYVHSSELIRAINEVLSRPSVEIIKPVGRQDLAEILRRRVFAHTKDQFNKLVGEYISRELSKEYPDQVKRVIDERGFWKNIRETYPFHPLFIDILEKLVYKLPYLQRTRDAIKIAVQTVLALRKGLFNWLEDEINLVMPYHIPIFINEILDETIMRNAPREYKVFQLILRGNVMETENFTTLTEMKDEEFYEKIVARPLRELKEEDMKLGVKLASVIWLHSLIGLGLPINMGDFPTTADLIYYASPTDLDIKGVLGILRTVLPQLVVHGEPDADSARWFFASIPSIEELIEILRKNVTDELAKDKLAELLEEGLTGRRTKGRPPKGYRTSSIFNHNVAVAKVARDIPKEILEAEDPALVIFADIIKEKELLDLLKGRNNVVVLAPHVEGLDKEERLSPEDIKGIRELAALRNQSLWKGLLQILGYYIAVESITEDHLKSFIGERINVTEDFLAEDMMRLLKSKVDSKKEHFYKHAWTLINRCYRKVYYHRLENVHYHDGLTLESDKPIPPIIEEFLEEKGMIPTDFKGENILSIFKNYLGKDPTKEPIQIGSLWSFIRTTDKANVPLISHKTYIEAVKDLIKSLDYMVKIGGITLWKPIFQDKREANEKDEGKEFIKNVANHIARIRTSWNDIELIYWENEFEKWLDETIQNIPKDKLLKIEDRLGKILDIRDIKYQFDYKNIVKSGKLFYQKRKYIIEIETEIPEEIWEGKEYSGVLKVSVEEFSEEITVKLIPSSDIKVDPIDFRGKPPLEKRFKFSAPRAGNYEIGVKVYRKYELLESRSITIPVRGKWIRDIIKIGEGEPIDEEAKVIKVTTSKLLGIQEIINIMKSYGGFIGGKIEIQSEDGNINLTINTKHPTTLELLWSPINNLSRIIGKRGNINIDITLLPKDEPEIGKVIKIIRNPKLLTFEIKRKALGGEK